MTSEFVNRVSTLVRGGEIDEARREVEAAGVSDPLALPVGEAIIASMTGRPAIAAARASEAVEAAQDDPVVLRVAAVCHMLAGALDKAEDLARKAANRDPSTDSQYTLGKVLLEAGHFDEAERAFQRVLEVEPRHFQALDGVGLSRARRGDRPSALLYFARAFDAAPDDVTAIMHLRDMYKDAGWALGAMMLARVTRQGRHPEEVIVALDLMCLLLAHGMGGAFPGAGEILDADGMVSDVLASSSRSRPAVQLQIARTLYDMQRYEAAREVVERLDGLEMGDAERANWHYLKGLFEDADGDAEEALVHYRRALDLDGRRWDAACNAISPLLAKGDAGSLALVADVLSRVPDEFKRYRPQLLLNEAVYLKTVGRIDEARPLLARVLALTEGKGPLADVAREVMEATDGR